MNLQRYKKTVLLDKILKFYVANLVIIKQKNARLTILSVGYLFLS